MKHKLTILIPNYNKAGYIDEAIQSVLNQKTQHSYKIQFFDDCSTDSSVNKIKKYVAENPRIISLHQNRKRLGLLKNIIQGYRELNTEYFCVLDPDDYWIDEFLIEKAINYLENNSNFTIYTTNYYLKSQENNISLAIENKASRSFDILDYEGAAFGHTSSTIFRNVVFNQNNLDFLTSIEQSPNAEVYRGDSFRNYLHLSKGKAYFDDRPSSVYRQNKNGIWNSLHEADQYLFNAKLYLELFTFFESRYDFMFNLSEYFLKKYQSLSS